MMTRQPRGFRIVEVQASHRLTRSMQRLRFVGLDLDHLATEENLHVRLHLPETELPDAESHTRYYTIRKIGAGWFDVDFVLHDSGPGASFARRAVPGMRCGVSGPCGLGIKPAARYLLAGDETALPAIARIAESLPETAAGHILIEVDTARDIIDFHTPINVNVEWFFRRSTWAKERADYSSRLRLAIEALKVYGNRYVWIAGEHDVVMPLRPLLKDTPSLCVPYWRRKEPENVRALSKGDA